MKQENLSFSQSKKASPLPPVVNLPISQPQKEKVIPTDAETVPESGGSDITVEDLVGIECEGFSSLDELFNMKDFSKELKPLDVEPEMLGCEMWEGNLHRSFIPFPFGCLSLSGKNSD